MALKFCVYKDCENFEVGGTRSGLRSIFSFPKDPQRREEWMRLGMVNRNIPTHLLLMCSDHFDDKYISKTQRRWSLVSTAKPKPCLQLQEDQQQSQVQSQQETVEYKIDYNELMENIEEIGAEEEMSVEQAELVESDNYLVESTVPESDEGSECGTIEFLDESFKGNDACFGRKSKVITTFFCFDGTEGNLNEKEDLIVSKRRRFNSDEQTPQSSKSLKILNFQEEQQQKLLPKPKLIAQNMSIKPAENDVKNSDKSLALPTEENNLLNSHEVSVFVFKGEEYVQMSKEYYIKEKLDLLKKVRIYENAFKKIKQNIDSVSNNFQ